MVGFPGGRLSGWFSGEVWAVVSLAGEQGGLAGGLGSADPTAVDRPVSPAAVRIRIEGGSLLRPILSQGWGVGYGRAHSGI